MQQFDLGKAQPSQGVSAALNQNLLLPSGFAAPYGAMSALMQGGLAGAVARRKQAEGAAQTLGMYMKLQDMKDKSAMAAAQMQKAYEAEKLADLRSYTEKIHARDREEAQSDYDRNRLDAQYDYDVIEKGKIEAEKRAEGRQIASEERAAKRQETARGQTITDELDATKGTLEGLMRLSTAGQEAYKPGSKQAEMLAKHNAYLRELFDRANHGDASARRLIASLQASQAQNLGAWTTLATGAAEMVPTQKSTDPHSNWPDRNLGN